MPLRNFTPEGSMLVRKTYAEGSMLLRNDRPLTMEQVHNHIVERLRRTEVFKSLSDGNKQLAEQLFDLVTYGTTCVQRRNKVVRSVQGDNLEGNILMVCGRNHLIPVFEALSRSYLRYGIHRPAPTFLERLMSLRFRYDVQGKPFTVNGHSQAPRVDADPAIVDLKRLGLTPV
jgi:hypothetical protein